MKTAVIIPPYGFVSSDPSSSGSNVTKDRVQAVAALIRRGVIPRDVIVPFPQRNQPGNPLRGSLGKNMADYVRSLPEFAEARIVLAESSVEGSWGTFQDIVRSYPLIGFGEPVHLHFGGTDLAQLNRMRIIWWATRPKGWTASFHIAKTRRTDIWRHEPRSYLKLFLTILPNYFRQGR